jgi:internalin A
LNLCFNKISNFSFLKDLPQLSSLDLCGNDISDISFLKDLLQLRSLDLSGNDISDISFLKGLLQLRSLDLSETKISDFSFLKDLLQLSSLTLIGNKISDISFLKDLLQLRSLDLEHNNISDISFLKDLVQLRSLDLSYNNISDISFLKDSLQLRSLDLSQNNISDISFLKDLLQLNMLNLYSNNNLSDYYNLKNLIYQLNDLKSVDFGNSNYALPKDCLDDIDKLRAYFKDGDKATTPNRNIKLLFLGDGCVGKSTLLSHLKTLQAPKEIGINERTEGIQLDIWKDVLPNVKVNVWDFGGQEVLHSTHRLFLGEQAIYVLVYCKESNKLCAQSETHNLKYWLDFIADYGKQSIVLLVENVINNEFDASEFPDEDNLTKLVADYKQRGIELITTQYRFDCKNNTDEILSFKDVIKNKIISLQKKYPLQDYPKNWYLFQEKLEQEKLTNKTISLERFNEIAMEFDISNPEALLSYFNATGVVGYYESLSKSKVILQLEWVLDAIYACLKLKDNPLAKTKGKLQEADFDRIWQHNSEEDKLLFKEYMLKSNLLCKPTDINRDYHYLCPALFDKKSIDTICWEDKTEYVAIQFNFMFGAIMQQLQVRILSHCHTEDEETFYQNYICFKDRNNHIAWVEMKEAAKELRIYCANQHTVQTILNEINKIYPLERTKLSLRKGVEETEYKFTPKKDNMFDAKDEKEIPIIKEEKNEPIKVFVTYCWTDEEAVLDEAHQNKVGKFVNQLREKWAIDATFDLQKSETNFNKMMYQNLHGNDKVIIVLSEGYAIKADDFKGGVGTEYERVVNDIQQHPSKYIFVSFEDRSYKKYPFGFQGNDTIVIDEELVGPNLPKEQNRLLSKLKDEPIVDIPALGGSTPTVQKRKFD